MPVLLRHSRTAYGAVMRQALNAAGYDDIPSNGLYIIGGLALDPNVSCDQLIKELRISRASAVQLVNHLTERGYLTRVSDKQDPTRSIVVLTERGQAAAATQRQAREQVDAELLGAVGADDLLRTRRTLAVLIDIGAKHTHAGEDTEA